MYLYSKIYILTCLLVLFTLINYVARCDEASEYITIEVPTTYTADDIATMLKNQVIYKFN